MGGWVWICMCHLASLLPAAAWPFIPAGGYLLSFENTKLVARDATFEGKIQQPKQGGPPLYMITHPCLHRSLGFLSLTEHPLPLLSVSLLPSFLQETHFFRSHVMRRWLKTVIAQLTASFLICATPTMWCGHVETEWLQWCSSPQSQDFVTCVLRCSCWFPGMYLATSLWDCHY